MCILACMLILVICGSWHDIKCFYPSNVQPLNRLVVNAEKKGKSHANVSLVFTNAVRCKIFLHE